MQLHLQCIISLHPLIFKKGGSNVSDLQLNGIQVLNGFLLQGKKHLDVRSEVRDTEDLYYLSDNKMAPPGLRVWVDQEKCAYVYDGTDWYRENNRGNEADKLTVFQNYTKEDILKISSFDLETSTTSILIWDQYPVRDDITDNGNTPDQNTIISPFGEVFYMTYFVPDSCVGEYLTYDVRLGMDIRVDKRLSTGSVVEEPGKISFSNNGIHHVKITIPAYENDGTEEEKTRSFAITIYDASLGDPQIIQLGKQKMLI